MSSSLGQLELHAKLELPLLFEIKNIRLRNTCSIKFIDNLMLSVVESYHFYSKKIMFFCIDNYYLQNFGCKIFSKLK